MRSLWLGVAVLVVGASVARADIDVAKGDAAFAEGLRLKDAGKADEACAKFKESYDANPNAIGTILNVALCAENAGKISTAYKLFENGRDRAAESGQKDAQKTAQEHLDKLAPDVSYLAIGFASTSADTKLVVNDEIVAIKDAGNIAVDPGAVTIVVSRPGRATWEKKLTVDKKAHAVVAVPELALPVTVNKGRLTFGKIFVGVGGAAVVTGVAVSIVAHNNYNAPFKVTPGSTADLKPGGTGYCVKGAKQPTCDSNGQSTQNSAITLFNVGNGFVIGGVVVAAAGAYLWFFGHREEKQPPPVAIVPRYDGEQLGLAAVGRF